MDFAALPADLLAERPHLFSAAVVPVAESDLEQMAELIEAIESVVAMPAYRRHVLAWAPEIAHYEPQARGVFFGYDFHLTDFGPRLIEINTNAGGALLAAIQAGNDAAAASFVDMFRAERHGPLHALVIVDSRPSAQYLYPEFLLFQDLFSRHGIKAVICDPGELRFRNGDLWHERTRIDLVYNRLTDFALNATENVPLRQCYLDGKTTVTPHPYAHALYADKRNLVALSDDALLAEWGVAMATRRAMAAGIPRTELVGRMHAEDFWARRRGLFFKPAAGYGAKATYRGDKMTRRVFEEVLSGNYVAQALVPPSTLPVPVGGEVSELKVDIRCYVYNGGIQLVAARLWQGQTTNFRTPGGGFARVVRQ